MANAHLHLQADQLHPFDARGVGRCIRHAEIFGVRDSLLPGETMRSCDDHDPLPLLVQSLARYRGTFEIQHAKRERDEIVIDFAGKQNQ